MNSAKFHVNTQILLNFTHFHHFTHLELNCGNLQKHWFSLRILEWGRRRSPPLGVPHGKRLLDTRPRTRTRAHEESSGKDSEK